MFLCNSERLLGCQGLLVDSWKGPQQCGIQITRGRRRRIYPVPRPVWSMVVRQLAPTTVSVDPVDWCAREARSQATFGRHGRTMSQESFRRSRACHYPHKGFETTQVCSILDEAPLS